MVGFCFLSTSLYPLVNVNYMLFCTISMTIHWDVVQLTYSSFSLQYLDVSVSFAFDALGCSITPLLLFFLNNVV